MSYKIDQIDLSEYVDVVALWEITVRETHDFLKEEDISFFKPLILNTYLNAVELRCIRSESGEIYGFSGVSEGNLEMLFVHPHQMGKGIGKALLSYAIEHHQVTKVDVNEQNPNAMEFYARNGFTVVGRSELDGTGKPYPIVHMRYEK